MEQSSLADYEWLTSTQAEGALLRAEELLAKETNLVRCVQTLRKEFTAVQAHLAMETVQLRLRAREKFSHCERMFFTRTGLEQATDEQIAAFKATRIPKDVPIADWCTGIGGDLLALTGRESWVGVDRNPVLQLIAAHNVAVTCGCDVGRARSNMRAEISITDIPLDGYWHMDPDRRAEGKRSVHLESFSPPLEFIEQIRSERPNGALKIAPASDVPDSWHSEAEREWISRGGECRQQVVWLGNLARHPGEHVATVLASPAAVPCSVRGLPRQDLPVASELGQFLHEPDPAVLAARLTGSLAQQCGLAALAAGSVYLTSNSPCDHSAVASFRILDQLPFDMKHLRSYFRERNVGRLEIKKRGVDCQPEQVRKSLSLHGDQAATLILTRLGDRATALVVERCV